MCIFSLLCVVFVGRLVCPVNVLYMELSYTGSLGVIFVGTGLY